MILPLILDLRGGSLLTFLPLVAFGGTVRAAGRFIIGHGRKLTVRAALIGRDGLVGLMRDSLGPKDPLSCLWVLGPLGFSFGFGCWGMSFLAFAP